MLQCAPGYCLALPAADAALSAAKSVPQAARRREEEEEAGGMHRHSETGTHRRGEAGIGGEKKGERAHQDRRFRGTRIPVGEQLLHSSLAFSCNLVPC